MAFGITTAETPPRLSSELDNGETCGLVIVGSVQKPDPPRPIPHCWLSWIAVPTDDQVGVVDRMRLTNLAPTAWQTAVDDVDRTAHDPVSRFTRVLVTPALDGWTLVVGPWCGPVYSERRDEVTELCRALSADYTRAHAYFFGAQGDGDAWLITEQGTVVRYLDSERLDLAVGVPLAIERRHLDALGVDGTLENPGQDYDETTDLAYEFFQVCPATAVARELSVDPCGLSPQTAVTGSGIVLLARTPRGIPAATHR